MSLLLEALKKAERAKEEAQRRARSEGEGGGELRLEPTGTPGPEAKPVLTRAELPDIKQPLEILSDDIAPAREPSASLEKAAAPRPQADPSRPAQPQAQPQVQAQAAERASAKKVFEAKFKEPNPRLPFFITMGFLGVFALGTVGYFWYQLRPPPPLVNSNPKPPAGEVPVASPVAPPPSAAAATAASAPAAIPGLPGAAVAATPSPAPAATVAPASAPARQPAPKPAAAVRTAAPAAAPAQPTAQPANPAQVQSLPPRVHPKVESGYAAYLAGDLTAARSDYQEALTDDASNRDALLGIAAIDVRTGRYGAAEATYLRLLQLDPNDAHAQAGLIALRSARLDPLATESRVKGLLATDPGANVLHFTLGNQLAQQGRWGEAQQEYFKAFAANPDNPDFAYNLAVSLDHMRQSKLALDYYRRAITLAEKRTAGFDVMAARTRAAELER